MSSLCLLYDGCLCRRDSDVQVSLKVKVSSLPLLPGAAELLESGIESTAVASNVFYFRHVKWDDSWEDAQAGWKILLDPQTSGMHSPTLKTLCSHLVGVISSPISCRGLAVQRSTGKVQRSLK